MLTKDDLNQIRVAIREEVQTEINPLKEDVKSLKTEVGSINKRLDNVQESLNKKLDKVQEDISEILSEAIDRHDRLEKRVDFIEKHLELQQPTS